jgi:HNH endonuclease
MERIAARSVVREDGCVIWTGRTDRDGYGVISVRRRQQRVHRVAWEQVNGPIPAGWTVDHGCNTRPCVEVEHMAVVTPRENTLLGVARRKDIYVVG